MKTQLTKLQALTFMKYLLSGDNVVAFLSARILNEMPTAGTFVFMRDDASTGSLRACDEVLDVMEDVVTLLRSEPRSPETVGYTYSQTKEGQ